MLRDVATFIIDGYNLLHRGVGLGAGDLDAQRSRLEVLLREFQRARPDARVVIVYDGAIDTVRGFRDRNDELEVLYSVPPQTADDLVLEECARRRGGDQVVVVSSDLKDVARKLHAGVEHRTSEAFADLIEEALEGTPAGSVDEADEGPEKPASISSDEVDEWARIFSEPPGTGGHGGESGPGGRSR